MFHPILSSASRRILSTSSCILQQHCRDGSLFVSRKNGIQQFSSSYLSSSSLSFSTKSSSSSSSTNTTKTNTNTNAHIDPQALASEFIQKSSNQRIPGTDAISSYLTPQQRMYNYSMAIGLLGGVSWIWWYSMHAVGGKSLSPSDSTSDHKEDRTMESVLRQEAEDARLRLEQKEKVDREVRELVALEDAMSRSSELEHSKIVSSFSQADEGRGDDENKSRVQDETKKRALWRRIVFFWRN